jgi:hypothetical protein
VEAGIGITALFLGDQKTSTIIWSPGLPEAPKGLAKTLHTNSVLCWENPVRMVAWECVNRAPVEWKLGPLRASQAVGKLKCSAGFIRTGALDLLWVKASSLCITWNKMTANYKITRGESINWLQMDIKHKTCNIRSWKKQLFLDISSTNIDTLAPSLYQCVETRSMEVFWLLSQPLPHLRFNLFVISETFATKVEPLYATRTSQHKQETFVYEYPSHRVILPTKRTLNRTLVFSSTFFKRDRHVDY